MTSHNVIIELNEIEEKSEFDSSKEMLTCIIKIIKTGAKIGCDDAHFVQRKSKKVKFVQVKQYFLFDRTLIYFFTYVFLRYQKYDQQ